MNSMRLFFALWPPGDLSLALAGEAKALARRFGGKPARVETIHLTLAFLGEVDAARLPAVVDAGRRVDAPSFQLVVDRLDCWRHKGLLWAGCAPPPDGLRSLVMALRGQLRAASIAVDAAPRFVPHLTLVRKAGIAGEAVAMPALEARSWPCSGFVLVHSRPAPGGREYALLESFPLPAPRPPGPAEISP
ncbi:MAG: RNA 2',3'-cyclic phosphodiesterase [Candidatus Accumulibacter sp.]|jgi:2'-5' RNA ligase|nr:RNA 2',3'-cyclic phosphodiesterase [Accumulibacter sp.]